jgi:hypothetical protein
MNKNLYRGIGTGFDQAPTLKSIRSMKNLRSALREINPRPIGCDGFPYQAFLEPRKYARLNPNFLLAYPGAEPLKTIQETMTWWYDANPVETIKVKGREILRATVGDRLVQRAAARKLASHVDRYLTPSSYAYRPRRSPEQAVLQARSAIRLGAHWALKTDVAQFFPSIDRGILNSQLADTIPDKEFCDFLIRAISPMQLGAGFITTGLPQGNGLSPVLSNLFMHRFDLAFSRFIYFRYADDLLFLSDSREKLEQIQVFVELHLAYLGLLLNREKTYIRDVRRERLVFLGYELRGGNIYPPQDAIFRLKQKLRVRGQNARRDLLKGFVRRFKIGSVRKLFRRLDRDLCSWYPTGITLTGLLDKRVPTSSARHSRGDYIHHPWAPMGKAASKAIEKALTGQAPTVAAVGSRDSNESSSPSPTRRSE